MPASVAPLDSAWRRLFAGSLPFWSNGHVPVVPENLAQSVLPGWNFGTIVNLTEENSAAPQTELAILQKASYGRQLGQISDALQVLISDREQAGKQPDPALDKFTKMRQEIEAIKKSGVAERVSQLCADLEGLRKKDGAEYARLRGRLLDALRE